jgi:putative membrane protein
VTDGAGPDRPYRRLSPLTPLVRGFLVVVVVLGSTWDDLLHGDVGPIGWVLLATVVGGAGFGTASWLRTKYWIEGDELRVDTGVLTRQSRRIRVDRLQGIDIVQPFVARLFGLAELKMDVAGGGAREGSLAFLPLAEAQRLRETLLARRDAVRLGEVRPASLPATAERVVARLDVATLLMSLVLSPETIGFVAAGVALGVLFGLVGELGGLAGVLPVALGFAWTQLRRLSAYHRFTVLTMHDATTPAGPAGPAGSGASGAAGPTGLQVRRGLFDRETATIWLSRVQGVVVSEPWMWRPFGWARLDVAIAGYGGEGRNGGPTASTVMPVAPMATVRELARILLTDAGAPDPLDVALDPPPPRARWVAPLRWRYLGLGLSERVLVGRVGLLNRRTHVVPYARVQSLQLLQGPWQRRLGLADLQVDSPQGPVSLRGRHRDARQARVLLDRTHGLAHQARNGTRTVSAS